MTLKEVQDENAKLKTILHRYANDGKRADEDSDIENRRKAARIKESDRMREADELRYMQREDRISKKREDIDRAEEYRKENAEIDRQIAALQTDSIQNRIPLKEFDRQRNAILNCKKEKAEKERRQLEHIAEISQKTYDTLSA